MLPPCESPSWAYRIVLIGWWESPGESGSTRTGITLIPMVRRTLFGPRITIFTKDGRTLTREGTGREFIWDFEEHARRMQSVRSGLAVSPAQYDALVDTCRTLDMIDGAGAKLVSLTVPGQR